MRGSIATSQLTTRVQTVGIVQSLARQASMPTPSTSRPQPPSRSTRWACTRRAQLPQNSTSSQSGFSWTSTTRTRCVGAKSVPWLTLRAKRTKNKILLLFSARRPWRRGLSRWGTPDNHPRTTSQHSLAWRSTRLRTTTRDRAVYQHITLLMKKWPSSSRLEFRFFSMILRDKDFKSITAQMRWEPRYTLALASAASMAATSLPMVANASSPSAAPRAAKSASAASTVQCTKTKRTISLERCAWSVSHAPTELSGLQYWFCSCSWWCLPCQELSFVEATTPLSLPVFSDNRQSETSFDMWHWLHYKKIVFKNDSYIDLNGPCDDEAHPGQSNKRWESSRNTTISCRPP